jgi:peptide/nickel transport system substrate-binding protein
VDYAWNLQVDDETLDELEAAGQGRVVPNLGGLVERIVLNMTDPNPGGGERSSLTRLHPFLSELKVRQALAYAIDREAIAALYGKAGQPASNILVSPANYQSPNTAYEFNLDKAAALLDEAGWVDTNGNGIRDKNGLEMRMLFQTTSNSLRQQTQEMIRRWLRSIGVEVKLEVTPSSDFFSSDPANTKSYYHFYADLQEYQDGNKNPDPGSYLEWWTCNQIPQETNSWSAGENVGRWCDAAYDALYRQSEREVDPQKRAELFIKMNDMIIEDVAVIPLVHRARVSGVSQTIEGLDPTPWDAELWNIKDWRRISP